VDTFWTTMNEAQATVIAAGVTCLAALIGVGLGGLLFGNKVKSLEDALKITTQLARDATVSLQSFQFQLETITQQVSATMVATSEVRAKQVEAEEERPVVLEVAPADAALIASQPELPRDAFKSSWQRIAKKIESIANDESIDGRIRARYLRIPRYDWREIVGALNFDGHFGQGAHRFLRAAELWESFKRRMREVTDDDAALMRQLAIDVRA